MTTELAQSAKATRSAERTPRTLVDDPTPAPDDAKPKGPGYFGWAQGVIAGRYPVPLEEAELAILMSNANGATASCYGRNRAFAPLPVTAPMLNYESPRC